MAIVKRRKRNFYTMENDLYEVEVKINLNKKDLFEFDLPSHYTQVFSDMSISNVRDTRITDGKVTFESMKEFEDLLDGVNYAFKRALIDMTQEKVLVISLEGRTLFAGDWDNNVFRMNWGGTHDLNNFINFKFERGLRVGKAIYNVTYDGVHSEGDGWSRLQNTFHFSHLANKSKDTMIVIPYTEEREEFLRKFTHELQSLIRRIDSFADMFGTPEMLSLMDNSSDISLLAPPSKEELDIIETVEVKGE